MDKRISCGACAFIVLCCLVLHSWHLDNRFNRYGGILFTKGFVVTHEDRKYSVRMEIRNYRHYGLTSLIFAYPDNTERTNSVHHVDRQFYLNGNIPLVSRYVYILDERGNVAYARAYSDLSLCDEKLFVAFQGQGILPISDAVSRVLSEMLK